MTYLTIYYYGLLFSFVINLFVLYANVYHNDNVKKSQYKQMVFLHCFLLLLSWISLIIFIIGFVYNLLQEENVRKKK